MDVAGGEVPTDLVLIDTDWDGTDRSAPFGPPWRRRKILARGRGADSLDHSIDTPPGAPQYQENEDARIRLMEDSGYALLRDGVRWIHTDGSSPPAPEHPARIRPLPEVGEDAFVDAVAATYEGTRDSWINQSIAEQGVLGAARADFTDSQGMDHRPEWWELAYTADGALVGVIMAARNPTSAVIAYVGVVPEQRGRGMAAELVRWGANTLLATGATEIRGDCGPGQPRHDQGVRAGGIHAVRPAAHVPPRPAVTWWQIGLVGLGITLLIYGAFVLWLWRVGRTTDARALAGFIPDCIVLFRRLLGDQRVSRSRSCSLERWCFTSRCRSTWCRTSSRWRGSWTT